MHADALVEARPFKKLLERREVRLYEYWANLGWYWRMKQNLDISVMPETLWIFYKLYVAS